MPRDWEFYLSEVEGRPASINLDLALIEQAPIADLPIRVVFRLHLQAPREDGLSTPDEFPRLSEIEDVLFQAADEAPAPILFVGRVTFGGFRDFFFYAADEIAPRTFLSTAMTQFPEYEFGVDASAEPDWATYRDFLFPSDREMQSIENRRVLEALAKHGDKHESKREVCHWLNFETAEARAQFLARIAPAGFVQAEAKDDGPAPRPFTVTVARSDAVDFRTINAVVLYLFDAAQECQGDYDGWETQVVREETSPGAS